MKNKYSILLLLFSIFVYAQENAAINGRITASKMGLKQIEIQLIGTLLKTETDSLGYYKFENLAPGNFKIQVAAFGFDTNRKNIILKNNTNLVVNFELRTTENQLNEIVISGTLKSVRRLESPVPVEVYSPIFFKKNPTASIYEALQNVNGVRPQLNCGVCNTGDIHINGLEGPYTLVLIDGMPIVSSLSTVYGLSGIPNSLVERIEIVKGPASSLYGSEAVGGLINIITKNPVNAALFSADYFTTSYL